MPSGERKWSKILKGRYWEGLQFEYDGLGKASWEHKILDNDLKEWEKRSPCLSGGKSIADRKTAASKGL